MLMEKYLTFYLFITISLAAIVVLVLSVMRKREKGRLNVFAIDTVVTLSCLSVCTKSIYVPLFEMCVLTLPFLYVTSSWTKPKNDRLCATAVGFIGVAFVIYNTMCAFEVIDPVSGFCAAVASFVMSFLYVTVYTASVFRCMMDVGGLLSRGNAWYIVLMGSESVYVVLLQTAPVLAILSLLCPPGWALVLTLCAVMMIFLMHVALDRRYRCDSVFMLMRHHEQLILASIKGRAVDESCEVDPDDLYKSIYERILRYFNDEKPYLKGGLSIGDVVSEVYTNKYYVSKAISMYSGRNFCQFVNHFRIMYSIERFRENPELRVSDLWSLSGFNSIVSYNMAFRLFMNENPSEWCRKEKVRIGNRRKFVAE